MSPTTRRRVPLLGPGLRILLGASSAILMSAPGPRVSPASAEDRCADAPWMDARASADERASVLVAALNLEQKVDQVHGSATADDFRLVPGIPDLCVPPLTVTNGPAGVGPGPEVLGNVPATALPSPLLLASTWDPEMARLYGDVQGTEMRAIGRNLLEAPDVDLARLPINGRTFEAYGEDPWLASRIAVANIRAVQSHGVIGMVKHYTVNNQEQDRTSVDAIVSQRVLRELYLPPFEAAVREARVASVMCSYNSVNGAHSCENPELLTDVLKGEWGFSGFVQSDFFAAQSTVASANAGMDLEMPSGSHFAAPLLDAVRAGEVPESRLDDMLRRRYREMFRFGLFDRPPEPFPIPADEHAAIARRIALAGTVLLRNEGGLLPLDPAGIERIAVLGPYADRAATGGGGSSMVNPIRAVTPMEGLARRLAGTGVEIVTAPAGDDAAAAAAARDADVALVVAGDLQTEGRDRTTLALPDGQDALIATVAAANPRTVVVLHAGAPVLMPWVDDVGAILEGFYPGGEDGDVTAALLFGDATPGGRLAITYPASDAQGPGKTPETYPGVDGVVRYDEGLAVGYRWYDAFSEEPLFPFGFGLSYTTFGLDRLRPDHGRLRPGQPLGLSVRVVNTGDRAGTEVVQVYVAYPEELGEPPRQLRAFEKVSLEPGESREVRLVLDERAFAVWDESTDGSTAGWVVHPGEYRVLVGTSAVDTPLAASVTWTATSRASRRLGGRGPIDPSIARPPRPAPRHRLSTRPLGGP